MTQPELRLVGGGFTYDQLREVADDLRTLRHHDPGFPADLINFLNQAREHGLSHLRLVTYPVARDSGIGEFRINAGRLRWRLYVAMPTPSPPDVLGLVLGLKKPHGDPTSKASQNEDIDRATRRYAQWKLDRSMRSHGR